MSKTYLLTLFFVILTFCGYSQVWKPIKNIVQADYLIYQTNNKDEADIIAFEVESELGCLKPGMIYLAPPYYSKGKKVTFVCDKNDADLIVYWTKNKNEVKWKIKK
jgi:hypothetical protein